MAAENIANILRKLAQNAHNLVSLLREEVKKSAHTDDKTIVLANTIIRKALTRAIEETLDGNKCCNYKLKEELCREETTDQAKELAIKILEKLGFEVIFNCPHAQYYSGRNEKMRLSCDMSVIKCEPELFLYWK